MTITLHPSTITGEISAIPSKSHLHRLLIYAALADKATQILCAETEAEDIRATIDCLSALGSVIVRNEDGFSVTPICRVQLSQRAKNMIVFPCGESGSTLRFMLPVVCALGVRGAFEMKGRLPQRPLSPLDSQLENHGIRLWRDDVSSTKLQSAKDGSGVFLHCEGQLQPSENYELAGDISSQYITGLLMALPLLEKSSRLTVHEPIESADYITMTLDAAEAFGYKPPINRNMYELRGVGSFTSPSRVETEGDWSNGAFWLCAGAMPHGDISLKGLRKNSSQGDRQIYDILDKMGVNISWQDETIRIKEAQRNSLQIDARAIPDLIPVLAAVAAVGNGTTIFQNASRLRIKESDRLMSTAKTLATLGADIKETPDGLIVTGVKSLKGGTVDAHGDHRIAMMAAIASAACSEPVTITGAQAVNKSYPNFWRDLESLGKKVVKEA
ncbi:MAG: 3-phosphoshikimate 1-carboxyvinyltransferase [Defluviitaleaceae bacterium]|nr:3-phosphoshikimate 1-carboxyvinyltransferase [Defluviitaleaceae bacterium]